MSRGHPQIRKIEGVYYVAVKPKLLELANLKEKDKTEQVYDPKSRGILIRKAD